MAEGDIFGAVTPNTNLAKRQALAALARGGTAERDAFLASQKAQADDKSALMADILARSTAIGAPAGATSQFQGQAAPSLDRRSQALTAAQGSRSGQMEAITAANAGYFEQVNQAVPIVAERARMERVARQEAERMQLEKEARAEARAIASDQRDIARDARAAGKADQLSDSELENRLLGAARFQREGIMATPLPKQGGILAPIKQAKQLSARAKAMGPDEQTLARQLGVAAGIDPARAYGVVKSAKLPAVTPSKLSKATGQSEKRVKELQAKPAWRDNAAWAEEQIAARAITKQEFRSLVYGNPKLASQPQLRALLLANYESMFPTSTSQLATPE